MALKKHFSKEKVVNFFLNSLIALFSLVLLISIYVGVQVKVLDHDYANFFGYSMFEVQSNSMAEAISKGDWIIVKLNSKVELKDIITYKLGNDYITHRVVEIHKGTYITEGDNNSGKDDPIDQSQIVGKVTKVLPGFGILRKTLFNPSVLMMLIIILYLVDSLTKDKFKSSKANQKVKETFSSILSKVNKKDSIKIPEKTMSEVKLDKIDEDKLIIEDKIDDNKLIIEKELIGKSEDIILMDDKKEESEIIEITMPEEILIDVPGEVKTDLDEIDELKDYDYVADELEKTQFFRIIPVDEGELDTTLLEIAEYEMLEAKKDPKDVVDKEDILPFIEEINDDSLTKIDLDLIRNNTRRNKNLIDAIMNIKKDEVNEILTLILDEDKLQTNEATIKNMLITTYIHARYYNYYNEKEIEYRGKNILTKINKILDLISEKLKKEYDSTDNKYDEKVDKYLNLLKTFAVLDQGKDSISELNVKREYYKNTIVKLNKDLENEKLDESINNIIKSQKSYDDITKYFLNKIETKTFYLDINKIRNRKNLFSAEIEHNIPFSKIYSDYIIDKTYSEGIISEDKTSVLFILLLSEIIKDMVSASFDKKYVINVPGSLFTKEKKLVGLLKAIDDEYAKSHILFLIDINEMADNKKTIKRLRKSGYRFAVTFKDSENLINKNRNCLYIADIIFVNKTEDNLEKIEYYIPADLQDNIVYDDIYAKFNNIEGD